MGGLDTETKMDQQRQKQIGQFATLACVLEVTAPKPGNVHRSADFEDVSMIDFLASAVAIGESFANVGCLSIGEVVLQSIQATKQVADSNTNLGLVLLMGPIAKAASSKSMGVERSDVQTVLAEMEFRESDLIFEAIRLAGAGGMGQVEEMDVHASTNPIQRSMVDVMREAAERDTIAREYSTGYTLLFDVALPYFENLINSPTSTLDAIVQLHVHLMAEIPDTLIARKCGTEMAQQSSDRAGHAIQILQEKGHRAFCKELENLDFWLRSDGNRRNPGTTADLVGATLFLSLLNGQLSPPFGTR